MTSEQRVQFPQIRQRRPREARAALLFVAND
jgi:hypothetical protein